MLQSPLNYLKWVQSDYNLSPMKSEKMNHVKLFKIYSKYIHKKKLDCFLDRPDWLVLPY